MPASQCKQCNQPVHWCRTRGPNARGSWVPVEISPDDRGTVRKTHAGSKEDGFTTYAEALTDVALNQAVADGVNLYEFHSQVCPARKSYNPRPADLTLDLPIPASSTGRQTR